MNLLRRLPFWFFGVLLLQCCIAPRLAIKGVEPDFVLLFVLYLGIYINPTGAMLLAFALGMGKDTLAWTPFGLHSVIYTIVAYFPHLFRARLFLQSTVTQLALVIAFSLTDEVVKSLYYFMVGQDVSIDLGTRAIGHLLWNLAVYLVLFRAWMRWLAPDTPPSSA